VKEYLNAQSKTNNLVTGSSISTDELHRFAHSDYRWADNKGKAFQHRKVLKGEVYQFEFGKNYVPEMSYEHRGLVLRVNGKLLYVLPIFSYDSSKHTDVYHPVDFPESKSDLYLLKSSEYSFIQHDSVLKLNDLRTVSLNRILYQQNNGRIDITSEAFKKIESLVFKKYFPEFHHEYEARQQKIEEQDKTIQDLNQQIEALKNDILGLEKNNKE